MTSYTADSRDKAVFAWDHAVVHSMDRRVITEGEARAIVSFVWSERGLVGPPRVNHITLPHDVLACASRTEVNIGRKGISTSVLLHELAHSMDMSLEVSLGEYEMRPKGEPIVGSGHDENWLGIYLDLLNDFMPPSFNKLYLMKTLHDRGLAFSLCPVIRCR